MLKKMLNKITCTHNKIKKKLYKTRSSTILKIVQIQISFDHLEGLRRKKVQKLKYKNLLNKYKKKKN